MMKPICSTGRQEQTHEYQAHRGIVVMKVLILIEIEDVKIFAVWKICAVAHASPPKIFPLHFRNRIAKFVPQENFAQAK